MSKRSKCYGIISNIYILILNSSIITSNRGWGDSLMDLHTTGPGFQYSGVTVHFLPSFWLTTTIIKLSVRWFVWKVGEWFPDQVWPKTLKWVVFVFQCDIPHQWIAQRQVSPVSVYWDRLRCHALCGMTFLYGSTLVKVPMLQAGTVVVWPQMFEVTW